jgi:hypothetical protein
MKPVFAYALTFYILMEQIVIIPEAKVNRKKNGASHVIPPRSGDVVDKLYKLK